MAAKKKDDGYIRFNCRGCGKRLKVRTSYEGGNVLPCPKCGNMVNVPIANIEAVAEGTMMEETGQPGRLNIDADRLMERLRGGGEADGPGSIGGPPSLHGAASTPSRAFARVQELDQLSASLHKISEDVMGQFQRVFRDENLSLEERDEQARGIGETRIKDIRKVLQNRLVPMRERIVRMERDHERLSRDEWNILDRLKVAAEAMELYARHVLDLDV